MSFTKTKSSTAADFLIDAVETIRPWLDAEGRLLDPVFGEPTQYGTPYFAHVAAWVCKRRHGAGDPLWDAVLRATHASLDLLLNPDAPAWISGIDRSTGSVSRQNHRDFFWPAVLGVRHIAAQLDPPECDRIDRRIEAVDIEAAFHARPPSNWAAVWLTGEWRRLAAGLSPFDPSQFDRWLGGMFDWIDIDRGLYREPGLPNAYDLFTRLHLLRLLNEGYDGAHADRLWRLADTGLRRSLALQLTDGSLASGHRSAGQTWTLTAQAALFALSARLIEGADTAAARSAAAAALSGLTHACREDGTLSPALNPLPPEQRVGYEGYTADGHYTPLALSFLADAIDAGVDGGNASPVGDGLWVDADPIWRAVIKRAGTSIQIRAGEANGYDGVGLTDACFARHRLTWAGSAVTPCSKATRTLLNVGVAVTPTDGGQDRPASMVFTETPTSLTATGDAAVTLATGGEGFGAYRLDAEIDAVGRVTIHHATPGRRGVTACLLPYLRETGSGRTTTVEVTHQANHSAVILANAYETLRCQIDARAGRAVHLPTGWESRRGLVGLLRLELTEPVERLTFVFEPQKEWK
jgi:hypothetical protein